MLLVYNFGTNVIDLSGGKHNASAMVGFAMQRKKEESK